MDHMTSVPKIEVEESKAGSKGRYLELLNSLMYSQSIKYSDIEKELMLIFSKL